MSNFDCQFTVSEPQVKKSLLGKRISGAMPSSPRCYAVESMLDYPDATQNRSMVVQRPLNPTYLKASKPLPSKQRYQGVWISSFSSPSSDSRWVRYAGKATGFLIFIIFGFFLMGSISLMIQPVFFSLVMEWAIKIIWRLAFICGALFVIGAITASLKT